jgi:pimeloyl-ACP methyl ester carboxylesterase
MIRSLVWSGWPGKDLGGHAIGRARGRRSMALERRRRSGADGECVERWGAGLLRLLIIVLATISLSACAALMPDADEDPRYVLARGSHGPVRIHVQSVGRGSPILLIHGMSGSTFSWRRAVPFLAEHHRVVMVDLKGHGMSEKPENEHYSIFDQAELVGSVIEQLDLRHLTVVGHSLGGMVTLAMQLEGKPDLLARIDRIALLSTPSSNGAVPSFLTLVQQPQLAEFAVWATPPVLQAKAAYAVVLPRGTGVSPYDVGMIAKPYYETGAKHALLQTGKRLKELLTSDVAERIKTIRTRALVLSCSDDEVVTLASAEQLHRDLRNSKLLILDGCAHAPAFMRPQETAAALHEFSR